jgi:hypothetical protein
MFFRFLLSLLFLSLQRFLRICCSEHSQNRRFCRCNRFNVWSHRRASKKPSSEDSFISRTTSHSILSCVVLQLAAMSHLLSFRSCDFAWAILIWVSSEVTKKDWMSDDISSCLAFFASLYWEWLSAVDLCRREKQMWWEDRIFVSGAGWENICGTQWRFSAILFTSRRCCCWLLQKRENYRG